jgi:hypothetical protein
MKGSRFTLVAQLRQRQQHRVAVKVMEAEIEAWQGTTPAWETHPSQPGGWSDFPFRWNQDRRFNFALEALAAVLGIDPPNQDMPPEAARRLARELRSFPAHVVARALIHAGAVPIAAPTPAPVRSRVPGFRP